MSLLLHINTALENAIIGISKGDNIIAQRENAHQKEHSSFLQPAIREMMTEAGLQMQDIDAVTVVNGPGSYTGLRVGLSAAKGICFALNKPLITISTLEWMAFPFRDSGYAYICPLIDARRMEVFTAMYDRSMKCLSSSHAMILDNNSFREWVEKDLVLFTGNAIDKLPETLTSHENAVINRNEPSLLDQVILGTLATEKKGYADLAYSEPFYVKAFYSGI